MASVCSWVCAVLRSPFNDIRLISHTAPTADIYEHEPSRRRECLYYLALGHYKLKNYTESKKFTAKLLQKEPHNMQALSLNRLIDEDVKKEGLIGMALAGGAVAIIGGITIAALQRMRR